MTNGLDLFITQNQMIMKHILQNHLKDFLSFLFLVFLFAQFSGCRYYTVNKIQAEEMMTALNAREEDKSFILHHGKSKSVLTGLSFTWDKISGNNEKLEYKIFYYPNSHPKIYSKKQKSILKEVHLYLSNEAEPPKVGMVQIPMEDIDEIHLINRNKGATITSYTVTTVAVLAAVTVAVAAASYDSGSSSPSPSDEEGSCPYIYAYDGSQYVMEGEAYAGAILQNNERNDYMPLPSLKTVDQEYQLQMSNELDERHYTNLARLMVVNHPKESRVLLDKYGHPHQFSSRLTTPDVMSLNGQHLHAVLNKKDRNVFFFNEQESSKNGVIVRFQKPDDISHGKLLLNGNNTLWLGALYADFTSQFGKRFNKWMDKEEKMSTEKSHKRMLDNDFPLSVYLKVNKEWKRVDYLNMVGTFPDRDMVIPIDFSGVESEEVEIKIESGFMFWELDYLAMDFSENKALEIVSIAPVYAKDKLDRDWTKALEKDDQSYMPQLNRRDITTLQYPVVPHSAEQDQTVFLHTKGYYELIRDYQGKPNIAELKKFKKPGYFSEYSRHQYMKHWNRNFSPAPMVAK